MYIVPHPPPPTTNMMATLKVVFVPNEKVAYYYTIYTYIFGMGIYI